MNFCHIFVQDSIQYQDNWKTADLKSEQKVLWPESRSNQSWTQVGAVSQRPVSVYAEKGNLFLALPELLCNWKVGELILVRESQGKFYYSTKEWKSKFWGPLRQSGKVCGYRPRRIGHVFWVPKNKFKKKMLPPRYHITLRIASCSSFSIGCI